jgi:hypothetical protein
MFIPTSIKTQEQECYSNIVLWVLKQRDRTLRQISRTQHFIVLTQTQQTHVQRLSSENKGVSPYISLQEARSSLTHI